VNTPTLDLSSLDAYSASCLFAPVERFVEDPNQPRREADRSFDSFVADVRRRGILQPVVVTPTPDGKLRVLFGARRVRAAKKLSLRAVPYVIATDPRHLDDYAQVCENLHRENLSVLDMATFVQGKVASGETRQQVAEQLECDPSHVTHLLALVDQPFLLELYHAGKCRTAHYLYMLRQLWEERPADVEAACRDVRSIGARWIADLRETLRSDGQPRQTNEASVLELLKGGGEPAKEGPSSKRSGSQRVVRDVRGVQSSAPSMPVLHVRVGARDGQLDLLGSCGKGDCASVMFDDSRELEVVPLTDIRLERVEHGAHSNPRVATV
jgi:ParB/RepB/Spo0J family partition protein